MERKEKVCLVLGVTILLIVAIIFCWRFYLRPVCVYNSDGSTSSWKYKMEFVKKKSIWPVTTYYNTHRNSMTAYTGNRKLYENNWIDFIFWNEQRIKTINVRDLAKNADLYPDKTDFPNKKLVVNGVGVSWMYCSAVSHGGRRAIIKIKLPEDEIKLQITVTDKKGNVTRGIIETSEIKEPK